MKYEPHEAEGDLSLVWSLMEPPVDTIRENSSRKNKCKLATTLYIHGTQLIGLATIQNNRNSGLLVYSVL